MTRLVIIGGSGFVGSRFAARLERRGIDFVIGDTAPSTRFPDKRVHVDVRDTGALRNLLRIGDVVVNLAAAHRDDVRPVSLYHDVNVRGMESLLSAAALTGVSRVVFTSSVSVYGNARPGADESAACNPTNEYGRTKLAAEGVVRRWQAESPERTAVIIRPTVVFGEGNRGNVYNLLRVIAGRRYLMVGSGEARKSTAYVENVAAVLEWSLRLAAGLHLFNYVDEPDYSMTHLVETVRASLGRDPRPTLRLSRGAALAIGSVADVVAAVTRKRLPVSRVRVEKFTQNTTFSAARIRAAGFKPEVAIDEALRGFLRSDFGAT